MAARQSLSNSAGAQLDDGSSEADSHSGSPKPGTSCAQSIFPLDSYRQAYLELHQASGWVIQFPLVTECIEAAEEILGGVSRCHEDKYYVSDFVQHVLKDVMRKGVLESNHRTWSDSVKVALLECCIALSSACAKGLASLDTSDEDVWSPPQHLTQVRRSDVIAEMLEALSWTFELKSSFAETFPCGYRIPSECREKVHHSLGLVPPRYPAFTTAIAAKFQEERGIHLIFEALHKLATEGGVLKLIDSLMQPLCTGWWLVSHIERRDEFDGEPVHPLSVMSEVLSYMEVQLNPSNEASSMSDADLSIVPSLLHQISLTAEAAGGDAGELDGFTEVRIKFFSLLLAKRSFSLTLVLIQDMNMLFAQSFAKDTNADVHSVLRPFLDWMSSQKVLQQLLGVNMHQRQYVDAVQKLLENMARVHALDTQTTLKLVESMLQEGVMDVEKDNIARVLKRVVKVADPVVLLGVLENTDLAAMKTTSDAMTVQYLLQQMIQNAKGNDVVQQCLENTWRALLTSGRAHLMIQHTKDSPSAGDNMFAWLCMLADRGFEAQNPPGTAPKFSKHYIDCCFSCLAEGAHLEVVLHTLNALLRAQMKYIKKQDPLDQTYFNPEWAIEQFVSALCVWLEKEVTAEAPRDDGCDAMDSDTSSKEPPHSFAITFQRFLDIILYTVDTLQLITGNEPELKLTAHQTAKLWNSTVSGLPPDVPASELEASISFFAVVCEEELVDISTLCDLVNGSASLPPAQSLSLWALERIHEILLHCNRFQGTIVPPDNEEAFEDLSDDEYERNLLTHYFVAPGQGHVIGMDYIFMVLIDATDEPVARKAAHMLVKTYVKPYMDFARCWHSWTGFVKDVLQRLCEYTYMYSSGSQSAPSSFIASDWQKLAACASEQTSGTVSLGEQARLCRNVCRCLWLVQAMLNRVYGKCKPALLPHHASAKGVPVDVVIVLQNGLQNALIDTDSTRLAPGLLVDQSQRILTLPAHSLMYIGDVREVLRKVCGCSPKLLVGQRRARDSWQLCLAGRFEEQSDGRYKLHVLAMPPIDTSEAGCVYPSADLLRTAPDVKMSSDRNLIYMLLHLADASNAASDVHRLAYLVLIRLRTWPEITQALKDCCGELSPGGISDATKQIFFIPPAHGAAACPRPAALLYTFDALFALMEPTDGHDRRPSVLDQAADTSQLRTPARPLSLELFSCPNTAVQIIIQAAQANYTESRKDRDFWLLYHHTVIKVLKWIVSHSATPDSADISHSAADSAKGGQDSSDAGKSPDSSEHVDGAILSRGEDVIGKSGTATMRESSSSSDRANAVLVPSSCGTLQMSTLEALLDFWILLATRFSNGLASSPGAGHRRSWHMTTTELSESRLLDEVMRRVTDLIQIDQTLLDSMLCGDSFMSMAEQLFFTSEDETFRHAMRVLLCKCVDSASPAARCHLLKAMTATDTATIAATCAGSNLQYYLSLTHIVFRLSDPPHEECVPLLQQLLLDELDLLRETRVKKPSEQQLTGHLIFLTGLWRFFMEHPPPGSSNVELAMRSTGNVSLLIDHLLFPEAQTLSKIRESGLSGVCSELESEFQPICSSLGSRTAAYKLLYAAVTHSTDAMQFCLHRFLEMLEPGPQSHSLLKQQYAENVSRSSTGEASPMQCKRYRGLQNAGATCYMNAIFQQLYMQPTVRALVLKSQVPAEKDDNVFFQVQRMFAHLAFSHASSFTPDGIWKSMKDLEGQPINVLEHQDAHEFLYQLHEIIDGGGQAGKPATKPMFAAMGGTSVQSIRCQTVDYESRKVEEFTHISVDVQSMHNLQRALDVYFQEELMEGDNAYHCDKVNAKVPAIKRTLLEKLPHTFVVQLKRFEFDFANGMRLKIQERFEFPTHLDLRKYTDAAHSESGMQHPASYFEYELKGIVVHTGNAFAGHYFSFVKERGVHGKWLCVDDTSVTLWNPESIDECCFGGAAAGGQVRPNSAYMLVYERQDMLEPIDVERALQAPREGQKLTPLLDGPAQCWSRSDVVAAEQLGETHSFAECTARSVGLQQKAASTVQEQCLSQQYVQHAVVPYGLPWELYAEVVQQNMLMAHASHWTFTYHIYFLRDIIAACLNLTQASPGPCQRLRRSAASGSNSGLKSMSCESREATPSKRFAADRGLGSVPIPLALTSTPGESKGELATQLSLKFCLSVLNYLPDADEELLMFFLDSAVDSMRTFALQPCIDMVFNNLVWRLPNLEKSQFWNSECSALHPDRRLRACFGRSLHRVVEATVPELVQGSLCCKDTETRQLLGKVFRLLDLVWKIFRDCISSKMIIVVDCLMESVAELALNPSLRCIMDQTMADGGQPRPVQMIILSLPQILDGNNYDMAHLSRASSCFWRLSRAMLYSSAQTHAHGVLERIIPRSCLSAGNDVPAEDAFLVATIPDKPQLAALLITSMAKNSVVHRVLDMMWSETTSIKSQDDRRVTLQDIIHEFWLGPYLAMSRARPDFFQTLTAPVLDSFQEVLKSEDDETDVLDRSHVLLHYLVLKHVDANRPIRLKIAFLAGLDCPPNTHGAHLGLFAALERALEVTKIQPGSRLPAQRLCRLLAVSLQSLYAFRKQDFQCLVPPPLHRDRAKDVVHTCYNTMVSTGIAGSGRFQEPLSHLYSLLGNTTGEVSDGSHCEQLPGGIAEEE